ncbi:MAG: AraC family transcriptional regulator [Clostridiales bacterium]|nr:AraC family transcriptional regulator [Clostridiales bacterium]
MQYICIRPDARISHASVGKFISRNHHVHPRRNLDSAVLLLGYSGKCPMAQDGREYFLKPESFLFLFPHHEHWGTASVSEGQSHFWCHFFLDAYEIYSSEEITSLSSDSGYLLPEYGILDNHDEYYILFHQLIDAAEKNYQNPELRQEICNAYIKIMLCKLTEQFLNVSPLSSNHPSWQVTAEKAKEWIRLHVREGITARHVADHFQYNSDYLTQVMKAETGMTLSACITHMRILEAKKLLLNTDLRIGEVALSVGFQDEKYFMKAFKKSESITPSDFRQAHFRLHMNME